jgi:uncharacterized membrane protein YhhN
VTASTPASASATVLFGTILAFGLASAATHASHRRRAAAVLKMTAATGYLALAFMEGALGSMYGRILLAGLALCWVGDLLLIPEGEGTAFLGGLSSFLLGHVAYACAFGTAGVSGTWVAAAALPVALVGAAVLRWLWRQPLPRPMRVPVVAYLCAISVMVSLAWGAGGAGAPWLVPLGAVAFMASDIFVARQRFVTDSAWNTGVGLPLYFLGQALLAMSA